MYLSFRITPRTFFIQDTTSIIIQIITRIFSLPSCQIHQPLTFRLNQGFIVLLLTFTHKNTGTEERFLVTPFPTKNTCSCLRISYILTFQSHHLVILSGSQVHPAGDLGTLFITRIRLIFQTELGHQKLTNQGGLHWRHSPSLPSPNRYQFLL